MPGQFTQDTLRTPQVRHTPRINQSLPFRWGKFPGYQIAGLGSHWGNRDLIGRQKGNLRHGSLLPTQNRASSPVSVIDRLADSMPLSLFTKNTIIKTRKEWQAHFINEEIVVENQVMQLQIPACPQHAPLL